MICCRKKNMWFFISERVLGHMSIHRTYFRIKVMMEWMFGPSCDKMAHIWTCSICKYGFKLHTYLDFASSFWQQEILEIRLGISAQGRAVSATGAVKPGPNIKNKNFRIFRQYMHKLWSKISRLRYSTH